ncbi:MAG: hypothetical protein ACREHV_03955 [Rhizomicrobium sp.]
MSLSKTFLLAGAAALVSSAAFAAHSYPTRASDVQGFTGVKAPAQHSFDAGHKGLCGTSFGPPPTTPNGIIAWNDTSGTTYNVAGGADFICKTKTKIKEVEVYGYDAPNNPELYNVTIYNNDPTYGQGHANDASIVCNYASVSGAGGGSYPTAVLTELHLKPACNIKKKGQYWVSVQDYDATGPWYWEVQSTLGGKAPADWRDVNNIFGSGCTVFDNNEYLSNCLGYTYPDYMLLLK